jgi:hypothetical protein
MPYLVQQDGQAYAYAGGRVQRGYANGRVVEVDKARAQQGEQLARRSAQERTQAQNVAARQPERVQRERPSRDSDARGGNNASDARGNGEPQGSSRASGRVPEAKPSPTPTSSSTPDRNRRGARSPEASPTPTPTPEAGRRNRDRRNPG